MKKYEVTKEAILAGVKQCPDAKNVLKAMFPEAFKKDFDLFKLSNGYDLFSRESSRAAGFKSENFMQVRGSDEFKGIAFVLDPIYSWTLKTDARGDLCLIPTNKI